MRSSPGALPPVRVVDTTGSTQADVLAAVREQPEAWPHLAALRARTQTAGRGRAGRGWDTDRTAALTASVVLRPTAPVARWPWLPLLTGLAVVRALGVPGAGLKWPNDVVLPAVDHDDEGSEGWGPWRKVAGVLADVVPAAAGATRPDAVVVGVGVNLDGETPVPWATTLAAAGGSGGTTDPAALLDRVREELGVLLHDEDGWRAQVAERCVTLGLQVRVEGVDGRDRTGVALDLDADGALRVRDDAGEHRVLAGDVRHLRTAPGRGR